jgi:glycosyltransferase involved in cell wall biosynthesis
VLATDRPGTIRGCMKVLQVSDSFPPAIGGLEQAVQALASGLAAAGATVTVATLRYPGAPAFERQGAIEVHRLDGWTRHLRRYASDPGHYFHPTVPDPPLIQRLQQLVDRDRPDVVHVHGWILHSCLRLHLPPQCALVVSLHDFSLICAKKTLIERDQLDRECPGPTLRRCVPCARQTYGAAKGTALVLGLRESRRLFTRVDMFLPISDAVGRACLRGIEPARVTVVPSFVDDATVTGVDARPTFLPPGNFALFVGAIGPHKGIDTLAEAHRRMRADLPLVVIGTPRADTPELAGTPQRSVTVRTTVTRADIMAAYRAATVVIVPSRWPEPLGLVAVEAMAAGKPVIASDVGGLRDIVQSHQTGLLVPPGDADALAEAMDRLLEDPDARSRMGRLGKKRAARYAPAAVIPAVMHAYERALRR